MRDIAERWLDWKKLGPLAKNYQAIIADEVKLDTRKLYSTEAFDTGLEGGADSLQRFVEGRREFLVKATGAQPEVK